MLFINVDYHSIGFPTPPTDVHSPYAWAHSPAALAAAAAGSPFSPLPLSPFPTVTSLLSPTASHPSSVSSSREDLQATMEREILKRRYVLTSCIIYVLDAFFRQIKSFRRFLLAFGLGLQTFYLINFN